LVLVAAQDRELLPGARVPKSCRIVDYVPGRVCDPDPHGQPSAVRRERYVVDAAARHAEDGQFLAGGRVPESRRFAEALRARGGQTWAVGRERHGMERVLVELEDAQLPAAGGVEEALIEAPPVLLVRALGLEIGQPAPDLGDGAALEVPEGGVDLGGVA